LRCDNGGEYRNGQLKEWCKNKGITLDYVVPYTLQLNGKAEKLNRTFVEKARAMLFDSNLDSEMWGEAILNAAYLLNRSPTVTIDTTPAEKWYGKELDLNRIRLFGCKAYAMKLTQLKKFESRTKESIFGVYRQWLPSVEP
jgi:transposase InsO family protein